MKNVGKIKKALLFLEKNFSGEEVAAYIVKNSGSFWYIYTSNHNLYFSDKFKKYNMICRKSFLKDTQVVFCLIPDFDKFSSKSLERGEKIFNLKP